jgi:hypothetical protein
MWAYCQQILIKEKQHRNRGGILEHTYALIGIGHPIPKGIGAISVVIATSYRLDGPGI